MVMVMATAEAGTRTVRVSGIPTFNLVASETGKQVSLFISLTFLLTWSLNLYMFVAPDGPDFNLLKVQMAIPAICVFLTSKLLPSYRMRVRGIRSARRAWYLWAFVVPIIVNSAAWILTCVLGFARFDFSLPNAETLGASFLTPANGGPELAGLAVVQGMLLAPVLMLPLTLGEELGWRGFLLPRLLPLDRVRAILVHSVVWGVWHAPLVLIVQDHSNHPVIAVLQMVILSVFVGTFLSWIYFASHSLIVPALAHGAMNQSAAVLEMFMVEVDSTMGGITGVTGLLLWSLVALDLWKSGKLGVVREETAGETMMGV